MVLDIDPTRPWVRQPFDSDLSFALLQEYLSLPIPRRLADVRRPSAVTLAQVQEMSWHDMWPRRAEAWDHHLTTLRIETVEREVQEDAKARAQRQGRVGRKLQRWAEREIDKLIALSERTDILEPIAPRDLIRAAGIGVRIERLALGDSTDKIDTGPDLSRLSLDELRQLREIQEKAGTE